jgi:hypothetical protein
MYGCVARREKVSCAATRKRWPLHCWPLYRNRTLDLQDPGRPSVKLRTGFRSPGVGLLQTLVKSTVFFFPILRPNLDRFARLDPLESEGFKFFLRKLVGFDETLDVTASDYSWRKALSGSIRVARMAGM